MKLRRIAVGLVIGAAVFVGGCPLDLASVLSGYSNYYSSYDPYANSSYGDSYGYGNYGSGTYGSNGSGYTGNILDLKSGKVRR